MRASKGLMRLWRNRKRATEDSHKTRNKKVRQTNHDNRRHGRPKLEPCKCSSEAKRFLCLWRNIKERPDNAARRSPRKSPRIPPQDWVSRREHRNSITTRKVQSPG